MTLVNNKMNFFPQISVADQSSPIDHDWAKKLPSQWKECDVINWLFDVAKKHNIPGELVMKGNFSSATGQFFTSDTIRTSDRLKLFLVQTFDKRWR